MFRTHSRSDLLCSLMERVGTFSFIPLLLLCNLWQRDSGRSAPARDSPDLPETPAELGAGGARKAELLAGVSHRSPGLRGPGCVPAMAPGHLGSTSPNQRTLAALLVLV